MHFRNFVGQLEALGHQSEPDPSLCTVPLLSGTLGQDEARELVLHLADDELRDDPDFPGAGVRTYHGL